MVYIRAWQIYTGSSPNAIVLRPAYSLIVYSRRQLQPMFSIQLVQGGFNRQNEQGQRGHPDDVPHVLACSIRSGFIYQTEAGIGARGVGNMAVRGQGMERAMQMFCGRGQEGFPRAVMKNSAARSRGGGGCGVR